MKFLTIIILMTSLSTAFANSLVCQSAQKIDGWDGGNTYDYFRFTAKVASGSKLLQAEVAGPYFAGPETLDADRNYNPSSERYRGHTRFSALEDAWNWFIPVMPNNFAGRRTPFVGFVQIIGENGFKGTVTVNCRIK